MIDQLTRQAMGLTKQLSEKWESRLAGRPETQQCARELYDLLQSYTDRTEIEDFQIAPGAFLGWIRVAVVLYLLSLISLWLGYLGLAGLGGFLFLFLFVFQFVYYYEILEPFFVKRTGKNVYGLLEPKGVVTQQVVICGHHDSAHVFNYLAKKPRLYGLRILSGLGSSLLFALTMILTWSLSNFVVIPPSVLLVFKWLFLLLAVFAVQSWFFYARKGTPGAGDNLASVAVAFAAADYFSHSEHRLNNTRLIIGSWDAEEAGLRGARTFVKRHGELLQSVPTYVYNIELLYDVSELIFLTSDINNTVPLSRRMAQDCTEIARSLGYECRAVPFKFMAGGTDAGEFAKAGAEATTIVAMNWDLDKQDAVAYHTLKDTIDAVDEKAVKAALEIAINFVKKLDR